MSIPEIIEHLLEVGIKNMFEAAEKNIHKKQYILDNVQEAKEKTINSIAGNSTALKHLFYFRLGQVENDIKQMFDDLDGTVIAICIAGAVASTLGYVLMWLTAVLFQPWRKSSQNRLWLQMSAASLMATYSFLWQWLIFDGRCNGPENVHIFTVFFLQVTFWFLLCGALFTKSRLVDVFVEINRFVTRSSMISWMVPVPFCLIAHFVDPSRRPLSEDRSVVVRLGRMRFDVSEYREVLLLAYAMSAFLPCAVLSACCVMVYARVMFRVWRDTMQRWSAAGRATLGTLFMSSSGVQCAASLALPLLGPTADGWTYACSAMITFDVFVYSILFLIANKRTREMWRGWFGNVVAKYWN